jgi:hypothetical protein
MALQASNTTMSRVVKHRMSQPDLGHHHRSDLRVVEVFGATQIERRWRQLMTFNATLLTTTEKNSEGHQDFVINGLSNSSNVDV